MNGVSRTDGSDDRSISRRSTIQLLAVLGSLGAFSSTAVADGDDQDGERDGDEPNEEAESADPPAGTEELLEYLAARYGDQLTDERLGDLEESVAGNLRNAETLDDVDLDNGDDLAVTFTAYRGSR